MTEWLDTMLRKDFDVKFKCSCGKHSKNGFGFYCFVHKKQTPDICTLGNRECKK